MLCFKLHGCKLLYEHKVVEDKVDQTNASEKSWHWCVVVEKSVVFYNEKPQQTSHKVER